MIDKSVDVQAPLCRVEVLSLALIVCIKLLVGCGPRCQGSEIETADSGILLREFDLELIGVIREGHQLFALLQCPDTCGNSQRR